mgnify:FL=1
MPRTPACAAVVQGILCHLPKTLSAAGTVVEDPTALARHTLLSLSLCFRLGWHDSGTYSVTEQAPWPKAGGATGSIRFKPEIDHCCNVGLINALKLVEPIKEKCPELSYADLFQLASTVAIEVSPWTP